MYSENIWIDEAHEGDISLMYRHSHSLNILTFVNSDSLINFLIINCD